MSILYLNAIGELIARRAVRERRHIVTELIGADVKPVKALIDALRRRDYTVQVAYVDCDAAECWQRNVNRGADNISAHFCEPYHLRWLMAALASV